MAIVFPLLAAAGLLVACPALSAQATNSSKKVLHSDGTVSESVSDMEKGELRESTYDARGVLLSKKVVLLDERGLPVQGVIYGGRDELVGSVKFAYDSLGRLQEEISLNSRGEIFRRKIQMYDQSGNPLPTKIVDYSSNAPQVSSNTINFRGVTPPPGETAAGAAAAPKQPGEAPQIQSVSPNSKPKTEEKKRGLFNLFKKKQD
jgi:hypothetical protein